MTEPIGKNQKNLINAMDSFELDISLIHEDPNQPRKEFDPSTLEELAKTIRLRGVKTPISVHPHKEKKGHFIINHGARRFRASILAGKKAIPAFVDLDYSSVDQIIENVQRDNLTPREIADFIGYQLSKGISQSEISRMIGKSRTFVAQHVTLLDLPEVIAPLYSSGKIRDITILFDLVRIYKKYPNYIVRWLSDENLEISRVSIKMIRDYLNSKYQNQSTSKVDDNPISIDSNVPSIQVVNEYSGETSKKPIIQDRSLLLELILRFSSEPDIQSRDKLEKKLDKLTPNEHKLLVSLFYKIMG